MEADFWAHKFVENPKAKDEVVDEDFDLDDILRQVEVEAEEALGEEDQLQQIDDWEQLS